MIVSWSLHDGKKIEGNEGEIKALQAKIGKMEEDIMECKKVIERAEIIHKPFVDFKSQDTSYFESNVDKKPEDVIRVFMMKESISRQFLDGLIVCLKILCNYCELWQNWMWLGMLYVVNALFFFFFFFNFFYYYFLWKKGLN